VPALLPHLLHLHLGSWPKGAVHILIDVDGEEEEEEAPRKKQKTVKETATRTTPKERMVAQSLVEIMTDATAGVCLVF
jgi:hypothetical protein